LLEPTESFSEICCGLSPEYSFVSGCKYRRTEFSLSFVFALVSMLEVVLEKRRMLSSWW
jgi:hypothetical protein